jgi:hypothetical protein
VAVGHETALTEHSVITANKNQTGFGMSVSIFEDKLAIGAPTTNNINGDAVLLLDAGRIFGHGYEN